MSSAQYVLLGLDFSVDYNESQVSSAYRRLALSAHPDKNPDNRAAAQIKFCQLNNAYEAVKGGLATKVAERVATAEALRRQAAMTAMAARAAAERKRRAATRARAEAEQRAQREKDDAAWAQAEFARKCERERRVEARRKEEQVRRNRAAKLDALKERKFGGVRGEVGGVRGKVQAGGSSVSGEKAKSSGASRTRLDEAEEKKRRREAALEKEKHRKIAEREAALQQERQSKIAEQQAQKEKIRQAQRLREEARRKTPNPRNKAAPASSSPFPSSFSFSSSSSSFSSSSPSLNLFETPVMATREQMEEMRRMLRELERGSKEQQDTFLAAFGSMAGTAKIYSEAYWSGRVAVESEVKLRASGAKRERDSHSDHNAQGSAKRSRV